MTFQVINWCALCNINMKCQAHYWFKTQIQFQVKQGTDAFQDIDEECPADNEFWNVSLPAWLKTSMLGDLHRRVPAGPVCIHVPISMHTQLLERTPLIQNDLSNFFPITIQSEWWKNIFSNKLKLPRNEIKVSCTAMNQSIWRKQGRLV